MLSAVKGYYDGNKIVIDDDIKLAIGQKVIITILEEEKTIKQIRKNVNKIDLSSDKQLLTKPLGLEEISKEELDNDLKESCQEMLDGKLTTINEVLSEYDPDFKI